MANRILIIEDDPSILATTAELLAVEGFDVVCANNGLIGLQRAQEFLPDLIISDIMMPGLDGHAVLTELRKDAPTATIPFIFLTAQTDRANMRRGMESGADDYLTKPFAIAELLATVRARLEKQVALTRQSEQKLEDLRQALVLTLPHELRTPLMGILGYADLLVQDAPNLPSQTIVEMAAFINESGQRLYRLVENYLAYANIAIIHTDPDRIRALRMNVTRHPQRILEEQAMIKARQVDREADLTIDTQEIAPARVTDHHLTKIVEELTDNTFKFSEPGTPVHFYAAAENDWCVLRFINEGRGMTPEQIANIGAYLQFDRKLYEQQGSGLGLIIAKRLAELHEGELSIDSIPGQQTIVSVKLPLA